jgi:putative porin
VPGALPDWLAHVHPFGDVTFRGQADMYARDNTPNAILDFNGINAAGGIGKDALPFLNTSENRDRFRLRARLGLDGDLTPHLSSEIRLSSGSLTDPGSESQTEGSYGQRYTVGIDRAYIRYNSSVAETLSALTLEGGRFDNPWFTPTELVYARDLQFEGVAGTARLGLGNGGSDKSQLYLSLGAVPVLEVPTEISQSKWLLGAQLGTNLRWADGADRLQFAASYYDFQHVTGIRNVPFSTLTNPTAPAFIRYGNTVFDISNNPTDPTVNLFALAAHFRLIDLAATYELAFARYSLALTGEAVRNIGYKLNDIEALTQQSIGSPQDRGYVGEISFGDPTVADFGQWRGRIGYRYVQSDAVIDAWTDADFHEAGTNAAGYYLWADLGVARNTWFRIRYLSGNEITGPRYGVDILQLDLNTRF